MILYVFGTNPAFSFHLSYDFCFFSSLLSILSPSTLVCVF
nr:MAG TPA: hypothetical protein [Caudoviricetes sp.]